MDFLQGILLIILGNGTLFPNNTLFQLYYFVVYFVV